MLAEIASAEVLLIVLAVGMLVFGSTKLPKIARGLGSAKSEFERGLNERPRAVGTTEHDPNA